MLVPVEWMSLYFSKMLKGEPLFPTHSENTGQESSEAGASQVLSNF